MTEHLADSDNRIETAKQKWQDGDGKAKMVGQGQQYSNNRTTAAAQGRLNRKGKTETVMTLGCITLQE